MRPSVCDGGTRPVDAFEEGLRVSAGLDSGGQFEPEDAALREHLRSGLTRCESALSGARVSSLTSPASAAWPGQ